MSEEIDYSSPFKVRIIEDCRRTGKKLDGKYGTCLGLYDYPDITKKSDDGNPLIHAEDGQYLWGVDCWWAPEEVAKDMPLETLQAAVDLTRQSLKLNYLNQN